MTTRFVYVLRLANGGFYVGVTRHLVERINKHFIGRGAIATRESRPLAIEKIYQFEDRFFGRTPARLALEVFIASQYAERHGPEKVRGAKHGRGWDFQPSRNDRYFIRRFRNFFQKPEGKEWLKSVVGVDTGSYVRRVKWCQHPCLMDTRPELIPKGNQRFAVESILLATTIGCGA
jgi:hypothetical protein